MLDRSQFESGQRRRRNASVALAVIFAIHLTGASSTLRAGDGIAPNAGSPGPYTKFAILPDSAKSALIWQLHEDYQWGASDQKPICAEVLTSQATYSTNSIAWTIDAIDLVEARRWDDLTPRVRTCFEHPHSISIMERAFRYLREKDGHPVPPELLNAEQTLERAGVYQSDVTDEEIAGAMGQMIDQPDKDAVLVYGIKAAATLPSKGGTDRGQKAAGDVLQSLRRSAVDGRLAELYRDSSEDQREGIKWVADYLEVDLPRLPPPVPHSVAAAVPQRDDSAAFDRLRARRNLEFQLQLLLDEMKKHSGENSLPARAMKARILAARSAAIADYAALQHSTTTGANGDETAAIDGLLSDRKREFQLQLTLAGIREQEGEKSPDGEAIRARVLAMQRTDAAEYAALQHSATTGVAEAIKEIMIEFARHIESNLQTAIDVAHRSYGDAYPQVRVLKSQITFVGNYIAENSLPATTQPSG